jgi:hypothetical protein
MYPYSTRALAVERARDLRERAAAARWATEARRARRARRGHGPVAVGRDLARRLGAPRWA